MPSIVRHLYTYLPFDHESFSSLKIRTTLRFLLSRRFLPAGVQRHLPRIPAPISARRYHIRKSTEEPGLFRTMHTPIPPSSKMRYTVMEERRSIGTAAFCCLNNLAGHSTVHARWKADNPIAVQWMASKYGLIGATVTSTVHYSTNLGSDEGNIKWLPGTKLPVPSVQEGHLKGGSFTICTVELKLHCQSVPNNMLAYAPLSPPNVTPLTPIMDCTAAHIFRLGLLIRTLAVPIDVRLFVRPLSWQST
jgi:hypothetical protein